MILIDADFWISQLVLKQAIIFIKSLASDVPDICLDTGTQSYQNHSIWYHDANDWNYKTKENQNINVHAFENA